MIAERADDRDGHGEQRDDRRAPGLQEDDDDEHDHRERLEQRVDDRLDRAAHEDGRDRRRWSSRRPAGNSSSARAMVARTSSEIWIALEPGDWKIGMATAGLLSSSERRPYCGGVDLDARDVAQPRDRAVGVALDDDLRRTARDRSAGPATLIGNWSSTPSP